MKLEGEGEGERNALVKDILLSCKSCGVKERVEEGVDKLQHTTTLSHLKPWLDAEALK